MLYLNIRHQLPQIGIRTQRGRFTSASSNPAQVHTNQEQATSNQGATQMSVDINSYPSRRAYGHRNLNDLTAENGQRGLSDVQAAISKKAQNSWSRATNGAKKGNDIVQQYKSEMMSKYTARSIVELNLIPEPEITVNPSHVEGTPKRGDVTAEIETANGANVQYEQGSVETYLEDKGFIRRWISEDGYDIYA